METEDRNDGSDFDEKTLFSAITLRFIPAVVV